MASALPLFAGEPKPPGIASSAGPPKTESAAAVDLAHAGHVAGLPYVQNEQQWNGPQTKIADIKIHGGGLSDLANLLRDRFKEEMDVVVPQDGDLNQNTPINLRLKDVTAEEVFGAMNQMFLADGTRLQWRLLMNGSRPTAVLRKTESAVAAKQAAENLEGKQAVVYAGDFTSATWPITKVAETLTDIVRADGPPTAVGSKAFEVRLHRNTDILVLSGSAAQIEFAAQTLTALRQQATRDLRKQAPVAVLGQVNRPGEVVWPQDGKMTIVDVISRVGGFTKLAKRTQIQLTRKGQTQMFNWKDLVETKDPDKMIWLQPGDVISVPQTIF